MTRIHPLLVVVAFALALLYLLLSYSATTECAIYNNGGLDGAGAYENQPLIGACDNP